MSRTSNQTAAALKKIAQAVISAVLIAGGTSAAVAQSTRPSGPAASEPASTRATDVVADGLTDGKLAMMVNKSQVVTTKLPYKTVSIANPDIADYNRVNDYEILLTAKKTGTTQLIVWDVAGLSQTVDVSVVSDVEALQVQLDKIFPGAGIKAVNVNGAIALEGRVKNLAVAEQAVAVAKPYAGDKVLNFLEIAGGQQVMLKVKFAEVSRTASSQLGISMYGDDGHGFSFGSQNGPNGSPIGALAHGAEGTINPAINVFGSGKVGSFAFEYFLQSLRRNNLLRVLAEPNVIAISGESASFLAGGEFPIPVPQTGGGGSSGNSITIEYKQFGVKLNFVPTVLGDGKIRLKVEPEVSDLDYSRSVSFQGFTIPGLTKRTLSTTLELSEGQTFAVAGLLNNRIVANKDVTPLLGDLPVIGALFRSVRYERSETELVVLVTPTLVGPMNPDQVGQLPGERWADPTELQLFLDAKIGSVGARKATTSAKSKKGAHVATKTANAAAGDDTGGAIDDEGAATGESADNSDSTDMTGDAEDTSTASTDSGAEPVRFRGQYGFVPATN